MAQYACADDTLKCFEWLESYRRLTDPTTIKILKMYLRFLTTFLVSAEKLSTEDADLNDLIIYVQEWVHDAGKTIRSLCANAVEESKVASEWQVKIDDLTSKIRTSYRPVLQFDGTVSNSCLVKLIDSVINNLNDLQSYKPIVSTKKPFEILDVKFRFLRNFVWLSSQGCIQHQKLDDLLRLVEPVATTAACLFFHCFFEDMDTIMETKFSQILLTIQLIEPELRSAYIRGLKLLLPSTPENRDLKGFLHCLLNDVKELLSPISYLRASVKDHVRNLLEELNFVIAFLKDTDDYDRKKFEDLLTRTKAVATKTADVIQVLLTSSRDEEFASKVKSGPLFDLLKEIDSIKKEMIEKYLGLWKSTRSNTIPKGNALGLIGFILGTTDVVLSNNTDSIAFVRHQLEIVQAELVSLRSLPCNQKHLEKEVTTVLHEAKHAIGSLIIRESPLSHCMVELSHVIKKIQIVNNKTASTCLGKGIYEKFDVLVIARGRNQNNFGEEYLDESETSEEEEYLDKSETSEEEEYLDESETSEEECVDVEEYLEESETSKEEY